MKLITQKTKVLKIAHVIVVFICYPITRTNIVIKFTKQISTENTTYTGLAPAMRMAIVLPAFLKWVLMNELLTWWSWKQKLIQERILSKYEFSWNDAVVYSNTQVFKYTKWHVSFFHRISVFIEVLASIIIYKDVLAQLCCRWMKLWHQ